MKKISQKDIDYILDNIDIVDLVSEYVKLEKRGKNYLGLCPFHNEKTPSFTVSPEKKIANCFGCGSGGNIFQILSKLENISYNQAIVKLGNRLGLELEEEQNSSFKLDLSDEISVMHYAHQLVSNYYNYVLVNTKEAEGALNYLLSRGLTKSTIKYFNLGYAPNNNGVVELLLANKIDLDIAVQCGLIGKNDNDEYYDVFKTRVMFPIKDDKDKVVAFSGRTLSDDKSIPKYYNTQETPIFEKRNVLYNLSNARQFISKDQQIILCEGYMDVIRAHQSGVKNAVALMGTALDNNKLRNLLNLTAKITLALDNDNAGEEATINLGNYILQFTDNIYKISFSNAKDVDEFISYNELKNKEFLFSDYVSNNIKHFLQFKIDILFEKTKNNIDLKISAKNEILQNIKNLDDNSLKDLLLNYLSSKFEIDKRVLVSDLEKIEVTKKRNSNQIFNLTTKNISKIYKNIEYDKKICLLFKYFFEDRLLFLECYHELDEYNFENKLFDRLFESLVVYYNNYRVFKIYKFISNIQDEELLNLATYIDDNFYVLDNQNNVDIVKDYTRHLKNEAVVNSNVQEIKKELKTAISEADYETQLAMLEQLKKYKK